MSFWSLLIGLIVLPVVIVTIAALVLTLLHQTVDWASLGVWWSHLIAGPQQTSEASSYSVWNPV